MPARWVDRLSGRTVECAEIDGRGVYIVREPNGRVAGGIRGVTDGACTSPEQLPSRGISLAHLEEVIP